MPIVYLIFLVIGETVIYLVIVSPAAPPPPAYLSASVLSIFLGIPHSIFTYPSPPLPPYPP